MSVKLQMDVKLCAAYVAGALSLEDAARVVALRGRVLRPLAGQGGVASVELPAAELGARLARFGGRLSVAAANSPVASLASGTVADLEELIGSDDSTPFEDSVLL